MWKGFPLVLIGFLLLNACSISPQKPEYSVDFDKALRYAQICDATYVEPNQIASILHPLGLTLVKSKILPNTGIQYFVANDTVRGQQIVAVRGTSNVRNTIVDAKFVFVDVEDLHIKAHKGFVDVAEEIMKDISDNQLLSKDIEVSVTGHSLGGAAAVLIGMHLKKQGYKVNEIYTYGQPKVTDRHGAKAYKKLPLTRFATVKDIVPLVPPLATTPGENWDLYWHLGEEILLYSDHRYTVLGPDASVLRGLASYYEDLVKNRDMDAHKLTTYMTAIEQKIQSATPVELSLP